MRYIGKKLDMVAGDNELEQYRDEEEISGRISELNKEMNKANNLEQAITTNPNSNEDNNSQQLLAAMDPSLLQALMAQLTKNSSTSGSSGSSDSSQMKLSDTSSYTPELPSLLVPPPVIGTNNNDTVASRFHTPDQDDDALQQDEEVRNNYNYDLDSIMPLSDTDIHSRRKFAGGIPTNISRGSRRSTMIHDERSYKSPDSALTSESSAVKEAIEITKTFKTAEEDNIAVRAIVKKCFREKIFPDVKFLTDSMISSMKFEDNIDFDFEKSVLGRLLRETKKTHYTVMERYKCWLVWSKIGQNELNTKKSNVTKQIKEEIIAGK